MSKEIITNNDDVDWEFERMIKAIQWRTIKVIDKDEDQYVDYHKVFEDHEQEELNGKYLVDFIVKKAYPSISDWK